MFRVKGVCVSVRVCVCEFDNSAVKMSHPDDDDDSLVQSPKRTKFVWTGSQWLPFLILNFLKWDWQIEKNVRPRFFMLPSNNKVESDFQEIFSAEIVWRIVSRLKNFLSLNDLIGCGKKRKGIWNKLIPGTTGWFGAVHILCWHWWLDQLLTTSFSDNQRCKTK